MPDKKATSGPENPSTLNMLFATSAIANARMLQSLPRPSEGAGSECGHKLNGQQDTPHKECDDREREGQQRLIPRSCSKHA
jgi:hypothetical protein